jgi:hypothetical protein
LPERRDYGAGAGKLKGPAQTAHTLGRGIRTVDRGDDRKKLLKPLLDRRERVVIDDGVPRPLAGNARFVRVRGPIGSPVQYRK